MVVIIFKFLYFRGKYQEFGIKIHFMIESVLFLLFNSILSCGNLKKQKSYTHSKNLDDLKVASNSSLNTRGHRKLKCWIFQFLTYISYIAYTVSRASCIWQNENGSCEAGPNSKWWWSFIAPMVLFLIR